MGLDLVLLTRDPDHRARWSYGGFARFRERLAAEIGVELHQMVGFEGTKPWESVTDPLVPLLNHSDCDGDLGYSECASVAPKLREILLRWDEDDYDRQMGLRLCEMMERVVEGEAVKVWFE